MAKRQQTKQITQLDPDNDDDGGSPPQVRREGAPDALSLIERSRMALSRRTTASSSSVGTCGRGKKALRRAHGAAAKHCQGSSPRRRAGGTGSSSRRVAGL